MTLSQIKAFSRHKSDRVCQLYIDNSEPQKLLAASSLSVATSVPPIVPAVHPVVSAPAVSAPAVSAPALAVPEGNPIAVSVVPESYPIEDSFKRCRVASMTMVLRTLLTKSASQSRTSSTSKVVALLSIADS